MESAQALTPPHSQKVQREPESLADQLVDLCEPQEARIWLFSRRKCLDGARSAALRQQGRIEEVIALPEQLRDEVCLKGSIGSVALPDNEKPRNVGRRRDSRPRYH